jgi:hypothetical protein
MSSSFQSTAFRSSARPIDTFVAEPSVLPKTGAEELADILQAVNPNLQEFIGKRIEKNIEKDKDKAFKMALDTVLADGTIGKVADATRKEEGDEAARQLIGGSIFVDRFYKQYLGELYGSQLDSNAKEAYRDAEIDTFNAEGEPIKRSIRSYKPTDPEFINWRQNYFNDQTQKILDLGGEIDSANFITNLQTSVVNLNKLAREENNAFRLEKVKELSNDYFNKTAKDWLSGKREDAQLHITNFINDTRKLGLTGGDAREIYTGLVDNIANIGQYYVTTSDVNDLDEVDDLIIGLGLSIPYGNNGGNLTQHPEWQEKIEPILENLEDELNEELTQGPKIDKAKRRIKLENKLVEVNKLPIETEEQRVIYKQKITELKNDRQFSDLNEVFKTNNYPYIEDFTAEILNIRTNMRLRNYEDNESPSEQLGLIKNKIVDLGITDAGILRDLTQAVGLAEEYKSIYDIFDVKSKSLFDDIDAFYRSQAGSKGTFGSVPLGGGFNINLGGLDNDLYLEKYNLEQKIDSDFEAWIDENFYKEIDGKQVGGPSNRQIKDWLDDKRDQIEKNNFKIGTDEPAPSEGDGTYEVNGIKYSIKTGRPILEEKPLTTEEAPAFGNDKFEVDRVMNFENRRGAGYGGGMPVEFDLQRLLNQENFPDFGGLAELVRGGESLGSGLYNAFNGGTTDTAGEMDITSKTIGEMEQMQADGEVFAVGAYQFTPNVLTEARVYSGLGKDDIMTPENQDRLFWGMLLSGRKRPSLAAYFTGQSDDLNAAHEDLALEFAAIQGPDGKGMYDNDKAGNFARIDANLVKEALINARNLLMNR